MLTARRFGAIVALLSPLLIAPPDFALAVSATPPAVTCTGHCETCLEYSGASNTCQKCGVDPACLGNPGDPGLSSDFTQMLNAHNSRRALHRVPALSWSPELAKGAQQWADACTNQHSNANGAYGENLAFFYPPGRTAREVFEDSWYCEIQWYDFNNPKIVGGFKNGCDAPVNGHFTQVIWKESRQLGCGAATCNIGGNTGTYWVCRYAPPGNWNADKPGVLAANVPPVGGGLQAGPAGTTPQSGGISPQSTNPGGGGDGRGEWSAFATDERGNWGYGVHQASEGGAVDLAVNGCGGSGIGCKSFWSTRDRCVAYAESRQRGYWYAAGGGASKDEAEANAVRFCQNGTAPANSCRVIADTSACR